MTKQDWSYGLTQAQRRIVWQMVRQNPGWTPKMLLSRCPPSVSPEEAMQIAYAFHLLGQDRRARFRLRLKESIRKRPWRTAATFAFPGGVLLYGLTGAAAATAGLPPAAAVAVALLGYGCGFLGGILFWGCLGS
jgi:hypothetical protein